MDEISFSQIYANTYLNNLLRMNPQWAKRWCFGKYDNHMCGCLGCADVAGGARLAGITQEQWNIWMESNGFR